jgi:hypothetical protein
MGLQNLSSLHKIGGDQLKKCGPFFKHASSIIAPYMIARFTLVQHTNTGKCTK